MHLCRHIDHMDPFILGVGFLTIFSAYPVNVVRIGDQTYRE